MAVDEAGKLVIVGGSDGVAGIYSIDDNKLQESFKAGGAITDAAWYGAQPVVATSKGTVKVFGDNEITFTSHAGSANALALHPTGDILASVGVDKSFVFYDLPGGKAVTQVYTDSGMITLSNIQFESANSFRTHHCCLPPGWAYFRCWRYRWAN